MRGTQVHSGNLLLFGMVFVGLLAAIFMGVVIGENDRTTLFLIVAAAGALLFAASFYRYVWQMALLLTFIGLGYRPTSFAFTALELTCALAVAVAAIFVWQKKSFKRPAILEMGSFVVMQRAILVWLGFVALHMFYNFNSPYRPSEFAATNAIKSYFAVSAPLAVLYYFSRRPAGIIVKENFFWRISQLCLLGLSFNLAIRTYELFSGNTELVIPVINGSPNVNILRSLGPLSMLLGTIGLVGPHATRPTAFKRLIFSFLLVFGTLGSVISGGRASVLFGAAFVLTVLAFRRRVLALAMVFGLSILAIATANLFSRWINKEADRHVQRSLQWVLVEKNSEVASHIDASTRWRRELALRALAEWQSHPRIFWFGRATYAFGAQDERAILLRGGFEALLQSSLRRGATHNLFTDLLVAYGLIGCLLYCIAYISMIVFLWKLRPARQLSPPASNLALACALVVTFNFIFEGLGGGSYRTELIWFMVVLICSLYQGSGLRPERLAPARAARPLHRRPELTPAGGDGRFLARRGR